MVQQQFTGVDSTSCYHQLSAAGRKSAQSRIVNVQKMEREIMMGSGLALNHCAKRNTFLSVYPCFFGYFCRLRLEKSRLYGQLNDDETLLTSVAGKEQCCILGFPIAAHQHSERSIHSVDHPSKHKVQASSGLSGGL